MNKLVHYFAYGSNLHPLRLLQRVPSAKLLGVAIYPQHQLCFEKIAADGSSKCNMAALDRLSAKPSAWQSARPSTRQADVVHGAIYQLKPEHKSLLDEFESRGHGYMDTTITLDFVGKPINCFTYLAQQPYIAEGVMPYHWYKQLVLLGAQYLALPPGYIAKIEAVESMQDPDQDRRADRQELIEEIVSYI